MSTVQTTVMIILTLWAVTATWLAVCYWNQIGEWRIKYQRLQRRHRVE